MVGILGGFTTFSAFGLETLGLLKEGLIITALIYSIGSVTVGILAVYAGTKLL
jgi:CrcB protein